MIEYKIENYRTRIFYRSSCNKFIISKVFNNKIPHYVCRQKIDRIFFINFGIYLLYKKVKNR